MNPIFSVIIPTYNRNKFLQKAIQSIFDQRLKPIELLILDDANDLKTKKISEEFHKQNTLKVKYIPNINKKGALYSRNTASTLSQGNYIAFLDDDDTWDIDYLQNAKNLINLKEYDLIISKIIEIYPNLNTKEKIIKPIFDIDDYLFNNPGMLCSNLIIKKDCFKKLEGYDLKISGAADKDLFIRAVLNNFSYKVLHNNKIFYKIHEEQWSKDYSKILVQKIFFFIKYFRYYNSFKKIYKMLKLIIYYLYLIIKKNKKFVPLKSL